MTTDEVYNYFGQNWAELNRKLKIGKNTAAYWRKIGYIPLHTQIRIQEATKGKLVADININMNGGSIGLSEVRGAS